MSGNPFLVNVSRLRRSPGAVDRVRRSGVLPGLRVTESRVADDADVLVDAALEAAGPDILVIADIDTRWVGDCRRCLRPVTGEIHAHARELYEERSDGEETYPLRGDQVDLAPLARDAVLLELPLAPLCQEDCQGLCPECGADRNEGDCGHAMVASDPRWAALDALRTDDD
jgi:uncharacterized protein